jgi:sulfate adenylyltransferase
MNSLEGASHDDRGFCAWFTGLSGAGKTTTAEALQAAIEAQGRRVTLLDGDVVREHLTKGLGFSREDRDTNVLRVGYVASQIAYHGGIALCSLISPYRDTRDRVRRLFTENNFLEVYVATPLDVCEERDPKGHYQRVRDGSLQGFTGIDDPYEEPLNPEIIINTTERTLEQNIETLMQEIVSRGFIRRS